MIRTAAILALLGSSILCSAPALAQATPAAPDAKMVQLVEDAADDGAKLVGEIKTGKLADGDLATFAFNIEPGKTYWVYGVCDQKYCDDLDLEGKNARGFVLDTDDTKKDADPVLLIADKVATKLNVTVMMEDCGAKTCAFGIGLYEQPLVWPDGPPKQ
jgi:hypothetical protein